MIKVDLHTHSMASPDGGITPKQYIKVLEDKVLDTLAITDHNSIIAALELHKLFPKNVIVGEEIMSTKGELIGLFLSKLIDKGMTALATAQAIREQGGLVYIPHPFETLRSGLDETTLDALAEYVDIVEIHNGRAVFQNKGPQAAMWAKLNRKAVAASSDAHGYKGLGTTYSTLPEAPSAENLVEILAHARLVTVRPPLSSLLYPKANRLRKRLKRS